MSGKAGSERASVHERPPRAAEQPQNPKNAQKRLKSAALRVLDIRTFYLNRNIYATLTREGGGRLA